MEGCWVPSLHYSIVPDCISNPALLRRHDRTKSSDGRVQLIIYNYVMVSWSGAHFFTRYIESSLHLFLGICAAASESPFELHP